MSKLHLFRDCIRERLTTAALEIFGAVEKTFAEFQEEIYNSKEESARLKRLLDIVTPPEIKIHRTEVQQLSLLEPPQIKEEQELWTSQEEEQLQGLQSETTDPRFTEESKFLNVQMSQLNVIRELCGEILTTAALNIYWAAEKPFAGYQEEISRSKEESVQLQRLLDVVTQPEIKLQQTEVQQLSVLEPPQIKEEQELWTSQEEEQLQGLQSETTDSIFTRDSNLHIRAFLSERLTTAASEIFGAIEIRFTEYQEEISRSEEERKRIQRLFDVVTQPEIKLNRTDVQQLSLPEPPQIKEEQEQWTSQEEEQLQGLQSETKDPRLTFLYVKHESQRSPPDQCSHLVQIVKVEDREGDCLHTNTTEEQIKAEPHVQDSAAPEPGSDSQPLSVVAPDCPTAQSLEEEEHGGVMLLQNRTQNNEALPRDNRPQGSHTEEKPLQCQQCKRRFADKSALLKHIEKAHTGEKPHQCQQCKRQFAFKSALLKHMRTHSGEKPFQCEQCNKRFAQKSVLVDHLKTHTGEKPHQCQQCNKQFAHKGNLVDHMRTHTGQKPFQCQQCNKQCALKGNLDKHMRTHTGEKQYQCQQYDYKSILVDHITHTEEKPYQCQQCIKRFAKKGNLVVHMRTHTGEKPYQCQLCKKRCAHKCNLVKHMRTHTGEKPYQCQQCNKQFAHKGVLVEHMRTHTGEKSFQCQQCNKRFSVKSILVDHLRTHTGEKPQCQQCNKRFAKKGSLVKHMRTHTGEKPYQCQKCNKRYAHKGILVDHMRSHTGEKPFQCLHCNKQYAYKCILVDHMITHTGEKPYQCQQCNKRFVKKGNLVDHMRTHTGEKPFQCQQCNKQCAHKSNLVKHMRIHTGEKPYQCQQRNTTFRYKSKSPLVPYDKPIFVVAPDCPAAQSLEGEHGEVILLQNRTPNNEALPRDNRPQGSHTENNTPVSTM
ncbi:zinc finger protein 271-like isoform X3 [Osmerus eperlanus]|uniref:zinc finger protein 271-like isoform X3 n=1 Tax=Osmerus eperlanus TaxID=29151 RepID=UPI002E0EB904